MNEMVTPAGKELLKNTINTAKFHNRILEENDMWRQWELEKGLTMMVSDDAIRKKGHHRCRYHEKLRKSKLEEKRRRHRSGRGSSSAEPIPKKDEKWDHSGFAELYPDVMTNSEKKETDKGCKRKKDDSDSSTGSDSSGIHPSSSDEEVWEEFISAKRAASQSSKTHLCKSRTEKNSHRKSKKHRHRRKYKHKHKD